MQPIDWPETIELTVTPEHFDRAVADLGFEGDHTLSRTQHCPVGQALGDWLKPRLPEGWQPDRHYVFAATGSRVTVTIHVGRDYDYVSYGDVEYSWPMDLFIRNFDRLGIFPDVETDAAKNVRATLPQTFTLQQRIVRGE